MSGLQELYWETTPYQRSCCNGRDPTVTVGLYWINNMTDHSTGLLRSCLTTVGQASGHTREKVTLEI